MPMALVICLTIFATVSVWAQFPTASSVNTLKTPQTIKIPSQPTSLITPDLKKQIRQNLDLKTRKSTGGWNGSGGGGIACFQDAETAKAAVDNEGLIKDEFVSKISYLSSYEYFRDRFAPVQDVTKVYFKPRPGENAMSFLRRILAEHYNATSPVVVELLLAALDWVDPALWEDHVNGEDKPSRMPIVDDMGYLEKHPRCHYVQLATRYQKKQQGEFPIGFMDADKTLLNQMRILHGPEHTVINEALLILHEALYLLGIELNHSTSVESQGLTNIFLNQPFIEMTQEHPRPDYFHMVLGDLGFYFSDNMTSLYAGLLQNQVTSSRSSFNKVTRFKSYVSLRNKIQKTFYDVYGFGGIYESDETEVKIMNLELPEFLASSRVSTEEAFMGAALYAVIVDKVFPNSEVLVSLQFDEKQELPRMCQWVRDNVQMWKRTVAKIDAQTPANAVRWRKAHLHYTQKASAYCDAIKY